MDRMERLARTALIWGAGYCVVTGLVLVVASQPVAESLRAPRPLIGLAGIASIVWGIGIGLGSRARRWRPVTVLAVIVNLAVAAVLGVTWLVASFPEGGGPLLVVLGGQVCAFAAVQAHALWSPFGR